MIRAVVFDFDGVLVDSVSIKTNAFAALFKEEGPEVVEGVVAYHLKNGGVSRSEKFRYYYSQILRRPLSETELRGLCDRFQSLVLDGVIHAPWINGAPEILEWCAKRGHLLFIVSGTPVDEIRWIAKQRGIDSYFTGIFGSPARKGDILGTILSSHELHPAELVCVGDSSTDFEAAQQFGIRFVARSGPKERAIWDQEGVQVLQDLSGLKSVVAQLSGDAPAGTRRLRG